MPSLTGTRGGGTILRYNGVVARARWGLMARGLDRRRFLRHQQLG